MITSLQNSKIKELMKLKQKKYRQDYYLVESRHLVEEALKAKQTDLIISTKEINNGINNLVVSPEVMAKLSFTKTPKTIMARCFVQKEPTLILGKRYLLLDDLQDPGNIGTLVRTALAFGIDQVILSKNSVDLYHDKLLRAMQGAHFHISCLEADLATIIKTLKQHQVKIIGSALDNSKDLKSISIDNKLAIIVGNEGQGMNPEILALCDDIAYIPINNIESLNVAVAGGIMMYQFCR